MKMSKALIPETYNPAFHGDIDTHRWIPNLPYRALGKTGLNVSSLSYGGSSLGGFFGNVDNTEAKAVIVDAIKSGVNYLDTSPWYGDSEAILGEALKDVPRNTYYIGTKVGRNFTPTWENRFDFSSSAVLKNVENSLSRLGLNYVDIIQVHDVEFCLDRNIILKETIPALESVVRAGKAKYIGITSYSLDLMKQITDLKTVDTILSYCRFNFNDISLEEYEPNFTEKNIGIINASPVSMGLLTSKGPPAWHPASDELKILCRQAAAVAENHGITLEKASLGFSLRAVNENIATTLVSMPTKSALVENLQIVTQSKTEEDKNLYNAICEIFSKNLKGNRHWEGVELQQYQKCLNDTKM